MIATSILACLAAALHVFIFWLEAYAWTGRAREVFGTTPEQAYATREMAYNQGFYNLFLAVIAAAGVAALWLAPPSAGVALVVAGCGSMLAAALVLALSSPDKRGAAVRQGTLPLLALVCLALGV